MHAARLLREEIANSDLLSQMVAAYLVGFSVTLDDLADVPPCASATQTHCALGWNAMDGEGDETEEVDDMVKQVYSEIGIEFNEAAAAGKSKIGEDAKPVPADEDLAARMARLHES